MNKIIIFLLILIIGTAFALSNSVDEASPKRISNTDFDCTLKAIKVCGSDDSPATNKCLQKYVSRCQQNPASTNSTRNHRNHHTYKTIIVKQRDEDRETKRICITDTNCNCKTLARDLCSDSTDVNGCVEKTRQQCVERCDASRRCYRLDCRNAGRRRCNEQVDIACGLKHPNSNDAKQTCIDKRIVSCLRYEKATCRRARRVYRFRRECEAQSKLNCESIINEDAKCNCIGQTRHNCLIHKVDKYRQTVRRVFDCETASKIICSEKQTNDLYKQCLQRQQSICEPVCERESRLECNNQSNGPCYKKAFSTCISKWKRNYCKHRAQIKCGEDQDCLETRLSNCKSDLPSCFKKGGESCDDNNKCTQDICDPVQGCINKPITCEDNNACTTKFCDPLAGCVYTNKNCDDGIQCTRDTCDAQTGECKHKFDKNICFNCQTAPCDIDSDCNAWAKSQDLASKCIEAYCNAKTGSCFGRRITPCAEDCRKSCLPKHNCDTAQCVLNSDSKVYECVHSPKSCDDHKSCTIDTCDKSFGCSHAINLDVCPNHPICDQDEDCQQWAQQENFDNKCKKAVCDLNRGICISKIAVSQQCDLIECEKTCKPKSTCETTKCVLTNDGAKAFCHRTPIICDDKKACTEDKCDATLGCVFTYRSNKLCPPGAQCTHNADCLDFETKNNLAQQCLKAICDATLGACVSVPQDKTCQTTRKECKIDCVNNDACDVAKCVKDATTNDLVCTHSPKNCDDGITCTVDTCDATLGCVHTYTVSDKCPPEGQCSKDSDCLNWGFNNTLGKKCQKPYCDLLLGACAATPKDKICISEVDCTLNCVAKNACETSSCRVNSKGDYKCKRISKNCDDGDDCTFDSCEPLSGVCSHTPINSPKCQSTPPPPPPPPPPTDKCAKCKPRDACETVKCVSSDNGWTCQYKNRNCDDGFKCTVDSCEKDRGCVNKYVASDQCPPDAKCKVDDDCQQYAATRKLSKKCKFAICDQTLGRCVSKKRTDTTCVPNGTCKECNPANACETATCVKNPIDNSVSCQRTVNTCNDGKECTLDSCDKTTGKCSNIYNVSDKCTPGGQCGKNIDCNAWAVNAGYDLTCLTPVCDAQLGSCKIVPNGNKCSSKFCKKSCPPIDACTTSSCAYDKITSKLKCDFSRKVCDDKNKCTNDSCDVVKGCVFTFDKTIIGCDTPICKVKADCATWASDNTLADKCQDAICDDTTKTCRAVLINNKDCNPCLSQCKKNCVAADACEKVACIADPTSKKCSCTRKARICDDKNACTTDVCDKVKGCVFTYTKSDTCQHFCKADSDCTNFGIKQKASLKCKLPVCDKATTSCKLVPNPDQTCRPITIECNLICQPRNACETAACVRKTKKPNEFKCVYSSIVCNDNKKCTVDTCDNKKGCVFTFQKDNKSCFQTCDKDLDCANYGSDQNLVKRCLKSVCDKDLGSCKIVKGPDGPNCGDQCALSSDCPQSTHGTVCCVQGGLKKCCDNICDTDTDCKCKKGEWGYCKANTKGVSKCSCKPICVFNKDCDDNDPCTRDVCMKDYGFCKNLRRCVDNSVCTLDICIPSQDLKSYTCKNPVRSCTTDISLLDKNFENLSPADKTKWLGLCSHTEGCKSCVVTAQCDDNNGCTTDSCQNQFCISTPIDNKWCDPVLSGQPITVEGYFPKFTRL